MECLFYNLSAVFLFLHKVRAGYISRNHFVLGSSNCPPDIANQPITSPGINLPNPGKEEKGAFRCLVVLSGQASVRTGAGIWCASVPRAARTSHIRKHYLGTMEVRCSSCQAIHFKQERMRGKTTFDDCCRHGRISIDQSDGNFPDLLKRLFLRQDTRWRHFQEKIRSINSSLSFASVNCQRVTEVRQRSETVPYVFRIQGKVYCLFNTGAHPRDQLDGYGGRKYGQLYVVGPDEADLHRREVAANEGVDFGLCAELDLMMRQVSPHAAAFQLLSDVEAAQRQRVAQLGLPEENMPDIQLVFKLVF